MYVQPLVDIIYILIRIVKNTQWIRNTNTKINNTQLSINKFYLNSKTVPAHTGALLIQSLRIKNYDFQLICVYNNFTTNKY